MCDLESVATIGGVECQPGRLRFFDDGTLEECQPTGEIAVGDLRCKGDPLTVAWHPGGKLRTCSLASDATVDGIALTAGRSVQLHPDGKVRNAWLVEPFVVDGWTCTKGTYLFADGKLEACVTALAGKVGAQAVPAGSMLRLRRDGSLRGLELGAAAKVGGKAAKAGDRFCFEDGARVDRQDCWMF